MAISSHARITGMASGLDTDQLVKDMMAASQAKFDKVRQQKTLLEWKQGYYKDITSRLSTFQSKYFGKNNPLSSSLKKLTATYSSPYLSISPSADSTAGNIRVNDIVSLASAASLKGAAHASSNPVIDIRTDGLDDLAGKSLTLTLDGVTKTVTFRTKAYASSSDVADELDALLSDAFGAGRIQLERDGDAVSLQAENSVLAIRLPQDADKNPAGILDFGGYALNRVDTTVPLALSGLAKSPVSGDGGVSFSINGKDFTFGAEVSLGQIMNAVNRSDAGVKMTYSSLTDSFMLSSLDTGAGSSIQIVDDEGGLMDSLFGGSTLTKGTDAQIRVTSGGREMTVTRSTNSFDIDGTVIELLGQADGDTAENIDISLKLDADTVVGRVEEFIKDYNELLSTITTLTTEKQYRDFAPLTEEQKAELTESEVKLWTEKAKSGVLRSDPYLAAIESDLRASFYSAVEGLGGLNEIGIGTGAYSEKGKLHLDTGKLREALGRDIAKTLDMLVGESSIAHSLYATDEQKAMRFQENGAFTRISDMLTKNLNTIGKQKGALILLVGSPDSTYDTDSDYAKRIKSIDDKIELMKDKLAAEENRYWKQFSAMETAMSKLQSQSTYISNLFASNSK